MLFDCSQLLIKDDYRSYGRSRGRSRSRKLQLLI